MISCSKIKLRGYHLDLYGHVNNSRYLEFLEEARWELLERNGDIKEFAKRNLAFNVANVNINYRLPAGLGDVLEVFASVEKIGTKSVTIHQEAHKLGSDAVVVDADVTVVLVDIKAGKPAVLDAELVSLLKKLS